MTDFFILFILFIFFIFLLYNIFIYSNKEEFTQYFRPYIRKTRFYFRDYYTFLFKKLKRIF
uniref:Uncharacterized protein n=1 Tax=viral metagenome TaxID=1070528 RepID=A0A6C0H6E8_9ZZZZ